MKTHDETLEELRNQIIEVEGNIRVEKEAQKDLNKNLEELEKKLQTAKESFSALGK